MDIPGTSDAAVDRRAMERAEDSAAELLQTLKDKIEVNAADVGTLRKELTITVPGDVIGDRLQHDLEELRTDVQLPGFRKGKAPKTLVERKFADNVRKQLKTSILGQAFVAATEKEDLKVLGDPLIKIAVDGGEKFVELGEAMGKMELPAEGGYTFTCEVEVKPEFELPELTKIQVKDPKLEITDEMVDQHIQRQLKIRGQWNPGEAGAADDEDMILARVKLYSGDELVKEEDAVQLGVRPTRLDGIPLMDLGDKLKGVKPEQTVSVDCTFPDDYERTDLRGKPGRFDIEVTEVKVLEPITIEQFCEQLGYENEGQLREFAKEDLEAERDRLAQRARHEQVLQYLIDNTSFEVPEKLSARQTDRAVMRKVIELQQQGTPPSEIEKHIDTLRTGAKEDVARGLKIEFILEKIAEQREIRVSGEEFNMEIARIAHSYNQRFDRVRDDLNRRGLLGQLAEQIRQSKTIQALLDEAELVEVKSDDKDADS